MERDAKRLEMADDQAQVPAAEQAAETDDTKAAAHGVAPDADWISMTTGDPALYIKDAE